jgi:hypothetical protein
VADKRATRTVEFAAITLFALGIFLPFLAIQYDTNGIDEAQLLEAGRLFHKNHMLHLPLAYSVYRTAKVAGYSGNSLRILQVMNAMFGAIGIGLCYIAFKKIVSDRTVAALGSFWLATSFNYWYFSTDAGYIMLAALFAAGAIASAVHGRTVIAAVCTTLSILTWQAGIFLLPGIMMLIRSERERAERIKFAALVIACIGTVYVAIGVFEGHYTPAALWNWVMTYGQAGTLPQWGRWDWNRIPSAALSALWSVTPVFLAAWPSGFKPDMQLGRLAVDLSLIAFAVLVVLGGATAQRKALYCLAGYAVFLPFIIWWDPFTAKWFLIPNLFFAGFLTAGLAPWIQKKYGRVVVFGCVLAIAGTNFVTTVWPRHNELGPDREMAQCVAANMGPADLFVSAQWGWADFLGYVQARQSINVIHHPFAQVKERVVEIQQQGGTVFMLDPADYADDHMNWLTGQTGVTREDLASFRSSPAFSCFGLKILRLQDAAAGN